jgi:hypothetical protein
MANSVGGEFPQGLNLGLNDGELAWDVGSLLAGGEAVRLAAGVGPLAKAAGATERAFVAERPGFAEYLNENYDGMGHHIWGRNQKRSKWLGGGKMPERFLESPFNKIRETNISRRDFLRNHIGSDADYTGGKIRRNRGAWRWNAEGLGWEPYSFADRLRYGTAPATHALVGSGLTAGTTDSLLRGAD